jgi:hypothetical protein
MGLLFKEVVPAAIAWLWPPVEGRTPVLCSQPKAQIKAIVANIATTKTTDFMGVSLLNNEILLFVLRVAISSLLKILINGKTRC